MRGRWIGAALVATAAAGVLASVGLRAGEALPGTTVAGVEVGGLERSEVRAAVSRIADERTTGTLPVTAGDVRESIDRSVVTLDVEGTVERAMSAGRGGTPLAAVTGPLFGGGDREIDLAVEVDEKRLRARLDELADQVDRPSATGGFTIDGLDVVPQPPQQGRTLNRSAAKDAVVEAFEQGRRDALALPVTTSEPDTTPADVEQVTAAARKALATPYAVGGGAKSLRLTQREVGPLLQSEAAAGDLTLVVDELALTDLVTEQAARVNVAPREAMITNLSGAPVVDGKGDLSWTPLPAQVAVQPGATGQAVDVPAATAKLKAMVLAGKGSDPVLPLVTTEPKLSTAQAMSVNSVIGTFTTYFQAGQPRAANIRRIAEILDGTTIAPGEVMSLNGKAGRRTKERGFVADGAIVDGELVDEVGGGVSQFATTLFNAAFFAGLPILEHKPHSFYISRYPVGRESTVYFGAIDVKIRNDTAAGILIRTIWTPNSVKVEMYGNNGGRQVSSQAGPREPREGGGFRIDVTRTVSGGDGVSSRRVFKTAYDPEPPS